MKGILHPALAASLERIQDLGIEDLGDTSSIQSATEDWHKTLIRVAWDGPDGWKQYGNHSIWSIPYLTEEACDALVEWGASRRYVPNEQEGQEYQIPEIVIERHNRVLHAQLAALFEQAALPVIQLLYRCYPEQLNSIQLAKYSEHDTAGGNLHVDRDSDISFVVALNDADAEGTMMYPPGLHGPVLVPQLLKGHALVFPGKTTLHKGMPVRFGERHLLVHWSELSK